MERECGMANLTHESLREASKHLAYELWMLQACCRHLLQPSGSDAVNYAVLESFLIHTRTLCAFLFGGVRKRKVTYNVGNQYLAKHYFANQKDWRPNADDFLDETYYRISKTIAHLLEERLTTRTDWNIVRIHNAVIAHIEDFIRRQDSGDLHPDLQNLNLEKLPDTDPTPVTTTSTEVVVYIRH